MGVGRVPRLNNREIAPTSINKIRAMKMAGTLAKMQS